MPAVWITVGLLIVLVVPAWATAGVVDPILFNATTNDVGAGDDPPGLGTNFNASSQVGGIDDPRGAFGSNTGPVEPNTFIFGDGGVPDNGNQIMGDGGETVDSLTWNTTSPVILEGYRLNVSADVPNPQRGTQLVAFSVNGELDDFFDNNGASGPVDRLFSIPQIGSSFELNTTRTTSEGPRIGEIDAIVPDPLPPNAFVNTRLFNAITNDPSQGDELPGLSTNFTHSPSIPGDTVESAFGSNTGGVEPNTFLFADGGTPDNGNNTFDFGQETIDFIEWDTIVPISLWGYEIELHGDDPLAGGNPENRATELVRFFVDGNLVDTIDFNAFSGAVIRSFGGPIAGDTFRVEFTRTLDSGPRVVEINAVVPEPGTWVMALVACGALALRSIGRRFQARQAA